MAVMMAMVEVKKRAAEAAIGRPTQDPAITGAHRDAAGAALVVGGKPHRDGADRGTSHHCQHDTTRAFHGAALRHVRHTILIQAAPVSKSRAVISRHRAAEIICRVGGIIIHAGKTKGGARKRAEAAAADAAEANPPNKNPAIRGGVQFGRSEPLRLSAEN
jgi:hypothetical protein